MTPLASAFIQAVALLVFAAGVCSLFLLNWLINGAPAFSSSIALAFLVALCVSNARRLCRDA